MRLAILVCTVALLGCGGSKKPPTDPSTGSSGPDDPGVVARTLVGFGQQPATGGKLSIYLQVADHTGATKSYPLGTATGPCGSGAGANGDIITVLRCVTDGVGLEFRAVYRSQIIVLRRAVDPSDDPDDVELLFQEVTRVDVPAGSKVGAAE